MTTSLTHRNSWDFNSKWAKIGSKGRLAMLIAQTGVGMYNVYGLGLGWGELWWLGLGWGELGLVGVRARAR